MKLPVFVQAVHDVIVCIVLVNSYF